MLERLRKKISMVKLFHYDFFLSFFCFIWMVKCYNQLINYVISDKFPKKSREKEVLFFDCCSVVDWMATPLSPCTCPPSPPTPPWRPPTSTLPAIPSCATATWTTSPRCPSSLKQVRTKEYWSCVCPRNNLFP